MRKWKPREASRSPAASCPYRRTVVKTVFSFLTRWARTHWPLWLSLGPRAAWGLLVSFETLLVRAHPRVTGVAELYVRHTEMVAGFPWEQV